jgi:hypothetical protein
MVTLPDKVYAIGHDLQRGLALYLGVQVGLYARSAEAGQQGVEKARASRSATAAHQERSPAQAPCLATELLAAAQASDHTRRQVE